MTCNVCALRVIVVDTMCDNCYDDHYISIDEADLKKIYSLTKGYVDGKNVR